MRPTCSPATGAARNVGMLDSVNLAWKLAADIHGWAPAGLLDTYHDERHFAGARALLQAQAQVALRRGHDPAADALREVFQELLHNEQPQRRLAALIAGTDIRYPLPGPDHHPLAGTFAPDLTLHTDQGTTTVAELMHTARPILLYLADSPELRESARDWGQRIDVHIAETDHRPADRPPDPPGRPHRLGRNHRRTHRYRRARAARSALRLVRHTPENDSAAQRSALLIDRPNIAEGRDRQARLRQGRSEREPLAILASMPAPLIEFPADDSDRALRFWHGVLGVALRPRPAVAGSGWQTDTDNLRLGVHERGPGPGDTACLPYFTVADLSTTLDRVRALGGSVIHPGDRWAVCRDSEGSPFALAAADAPIQ
jgi:predicted enzyme related to lactoylglutathione lyase